LIGELAQFRQHNALVGPLLARAFHAIHFHSQPEAPREMLHPLRLEKHQIIGVVVNLRTVIPLSAPTPSSPFNGASDRTISAVTLTLAKETDSREIVRSLQNAPRLRDADLFLFQEVVHTDAQPSVAEEAAQSLGHHAAFAASAPGVYDQGLGVVSRYPISAV